MATSSTSQFPTSVRFTAEQSARVEQAAQRWGCTRSEAIGRLVDAIGDEEGSAGLNEEVVAVVEGATYRPPRELPNARRFRLVTPFKSVVGIDYYDFPAGMVFDRDLHGLELLQKMFERHAALEPLPD